jgi:uncharacterized membrane protein
VNNVLRGLFHTLGSLLSIIIAVWAVFAAGEDFISSPSALAFIGTMAVVAGAVLLFRLGLGCLNHIGEALRRHPHER